MLKKLICISILPSLYVEVTPNGQWLDEPGGQRAVVSPRRSSSPWKGLWPEPGWRSKPLSQLQVARFLSPLLLFSPHSGQPPLLQRCSLSPRAAPADADTSGRSPPAGTPLPASPGAAQAPDTLPACSQGPAPGPKPPSRSIPGLRHPVEKVPLTAWKGHGAGSDALENKAGASMCKPLKSCTPKGYHRPRLLCRCLKEKSLSSAAHINLDNPY